METTRDEVIYAMNIDILRSVTTKVKTLGLRLKEI